VRFGGPLMYPITTTARLKMLIREFRSRYSWSYL
jgi:hypothetical protein